eukprot:2359185-Pyramimonas_sp.AAC.1
MPGVAQQRRQPLAQRRHWQAPVPVGLRRTTYSGQGVLQRTHQRHPYGRRLRQRRHALRQHLQHHRCHTIVTRLQHHRRDTIVTPNASQASAVVTNRHAACLEALAGVTLLSRQAPGRGAYRRNMRIEPHSRRYLYTCRCYIIVTQRALGHPAGVTQSSHSVLSDTLQVLHNCHAPAARGSSRIGTPPSCWRRTQPPAGAASPSPTPPPRRRIPPPPSIRRSARAPTASRRGAAPAVGCGYPSSRGRDMSQK